MADSNAPSSYSYSKAMNLADRVLHLILAPGVSMIEKKRATHADTIITEQSLSKTSLSETMPRLSALVVRTRRALLHSQGAFKRRRRVSKFLYVVFAIHVVVVSLLMYPVVTPTKRYDGIMLALVIGVMIHWAMLKGECILSFLEKRLFYDNYVLGKAPMHHWIMDVVSPNMSVVVALTVFIGIGACLACIIIRNTRCGLGELMHAMQFGPVVLEITARVSRRP
jgi:hypothetical protein